MTVLKKYQYLLNETLNIPFHFLDLIGFVNILFFFFNPLEIDRLKFQILYLLH